MEHGRGPTREEPGRNQAVRAWLKAFPGNRLMTDSGRPVRVRQEVKRVVFQSLPQKMAQAIVWAQDGEDGADWQGEKEI